MEDIRLCRICLGDNTKFYHIDKYDLRTYYEEILDIQNTSKDGLPQYFCYLCIALLSKHREFKQRCERAHIFLTKMPRINLKLTENSIKHINRNNNNLILPFNFWVYSKRTLSVKYTDPQSDFIECLETKNGATTVNKTEHDPFFQSSICDYTMQFFEVKNENQDDADSLSIHDSESLDINFTVAGENHENEATGHPLSIGLPKTSLNVPTFLNNHTGKHSIKKGIITKRKSIRTKNESKNTNYKLFTLKKSKKREKNKLKTKEKSRVVFLNKDNWEEVNLTEKDQLEAFSKKLSIPAYKQSPHPCKLCHRGFQEEDAFAAHRMHHDEEFGQYECWICKLRFKLKSRLLSHQLTHSRRYKCKRCSYTSVNKTIAKLHDKFHEGVVYECQECNLTFKKEMSFRTHRRIAHRSDFICPLCGENFLNDIGFNAHQKKMHPPESIAKGTDEDKGVHCEKCDITFRNQHAYYKHLVTSSRHDDTESINMPRRSRVKDKLRLRPKKSKGLITCHVCNKQFKETPYVKHFKEEHPDETIEKHYMCEVCGFSTIRLTFLEIHQKIHGDRNYSCTECKWKFKTANALRHHKLVHTKQRHKCQQCEKTYSHPETLRWHVRTVHEKKPDLKKERKQKKREQITRTSQIHIPPEHQGDFLGSFMMYGNTNMTY